jgi:GTP-binding protein
MTRDLAGSRLRFLGAFASEVPSTGLPQIAFAGRSNVGKSSCINVLADVHGAARVSRTPGRTQTINLFEVDARYVFVDLPGYGYAQVSERVRHGWRKLVERYLDQCEELRLVVLLIDVRREPGGMDAALLWRLREARIPVVAVATRSDKLTRNELEKALSALQLEYRLPPSDFVAFSALTRLGRDELKKRIEAAAAPEKGAPSRRNAGRRET